MTDREKLLMYYDMSEDRFKKAIMESAELGYQCAVSTALHDAVDNLGLEHTLEVINKVKEAQSRVQQTRQRPEAK